MARRRPVSIPLIGYAPFLQFDVIQHELSYWICVNSLNRVRSISTDEMWDELTKSKCVSIPLIGYAPFLHTGSYT